MTYDANNNSTSDLEQNWVNSAWVNSYQYISTYDANNNNTIELNQSWINGAWVSTNKYTYTYDANHNKTSELTDTGAVLGHEYKYTYTYDTHNNKITQIYNGGWNGTIWTGYNDTLQYINVYDYVPNLISSTAQNKYQGVWQDQDKHTYTYDGNNNKTIDLHESWNGSVWVNSGKTLYTYDAHNNKTSELPLTWDNTNSVWVNSSNGYKYIYVYDANNNQTNELDQRWNGSTWINIYQNSNNFDANNFEKSWAYKDWNNTGTKITSGDSSHIYFHTVTGINEIAIENNVMIYPNPFTFQTTISFDKEIKNANIKIIDILGKEVKTVILSGAKNLIIEKGDMKAGIYFVQIIDENKNVMNRKIMIQ
jgi:hypothetical protein